MAKKKSLAIEEALSTSPSPQKWQQQFSDGHQPMQGQRSGKSQQKTDRLQRKTYLVTNELIQRAEAQAQVYHVGVNEMVRYCLDYALSLMESGKHTPAVQRGNRQKDYLKCLVHLSTHLYVY